MQLVLDNIRSCYNVGAILRSAEGFGVERVILSGYTPRVHDANLLPHLRDKLDREIHKTALGAEDMLDIYSCDDIKHELIKLKSQGWQIIGLENNIKDERLIVINSPEFKKILSDNSYDKVPFFGQEYATKIGYAFANDKLGIHEAAVEWLYSCQTDL